MRRVAVSPIEVSVEEVGQDGDLPAGALGGDDVEYEPGTPAGSDAEQGVFELGDDQEVRDAVASERSYEDAAGDSIQAFRSGGCRTLHQSCSLPGLVHSLCQRTRQGTSSSEKA